MAGLSHAALIARLVRVAASVLEAPLAALFRLDGEKGSLVERVVRLEQASEVTQMTPPAARLKLEARRLWHAASRTRAPTELIVFPSSMRVAWALSTPFFDAKRNQIGLLVIADKRAHTENDERLAALDDLCELLEDKLKSGSDRAHPLRSDEPTSRPLQREESSSERRIPFDPVTGLPDRASLLDETVRGVERASVLQLGLAVVIVALDRFRRVNERLGQAVGDTVLRQVGERLRESVDEADLVGRRSGDEFAVVVADDGSPGGVLALVDRLNRIAETLDHPRRGDSVSRSGVGWGAPNRLRRAGGGSASDPPEGRATHDSASRRSRVEHAIREPYHHHGHELTITASIGVARFPTDSSDAQSLFRSADIALARAKQSGRGKLVVFDHAMQEAVTTRAELERELRITMREGHLLLHYQPKFRVEDRALVGAEALLRWRHPSKGLISPGQFIPVAEDSGLIVPIGTWALGEVCRQRAAWHRAGLAMGRVSVNVSALQFARPDFVGTVTRAMRAANMQRGELELKLTESIVMDDVEHVAARLGELRKPGVAVSIDDFGTGCSSLAYLQRLPVDVLKIDRSFVRPLDLGGDEARGARSLAGSIATLAQGLGLEVLAEGVETEGQFQALADLGCEVIQGFLLGRPVPAADLEAVARARPG